MHSDIKKRRSSFLVALLFNAGDLRRSATASRNADLSNFNALFCDSVAEQNVEAESR